MTQAIEVAFPGRFIRNGAGQLVSIDLRPVNFDSARRDSLRVGFDFSKPLKSRRPSQAVIDQIRQQFGFGGRGPQPGSAGSTPPSGTAPQGGPAPGGIEAAVAVSAEDGAVAVAEAAASSAAAAAAAAGACNFR